MSVSIRTGPAYDQPDASLDREAAIAALLTVRQPEPDPLDDVPGGRQRGRRYVEARLEAGDVVTVVGTALPFGHLADPDGADRMDRAGDPLLGLDDPEVAMNIAEAREPASSRRPRTPGATRRSRGSASGVRCARRSSTTGVAAPALATEAEAAAMERTWDLEPDLLVVAAVPDAPLLIAGGAPEEVVAREEGRFLVGLLGAVLAIGSAIAGAVVLAIQ